MDLLAKRYASPFLIIDEMLLQGRFYEFVCEINTIAAEEESDHKLWELWLHRVFDKPFDEWKRSLEQRASPEVNKIEIEATVKNSFDILDGFDPQGGR